MNGGRKPLYIRYSTISISQIPLVFSMNGSRRLPFSAFLFIVSLSHMSGSSLLTCITCLILAFTTNALDANTSTHFIQRRTLCPMLMWICLPDLSVFISRYQRRWLGGYQGHYLQIGLPQGFRGGYCLGQPKYVQLCLRGGKDPWLSQEHKANSLGVCIGRTPTIPINLSQSSNHHKQTWVTT